MLKSLKILSLCAITIPCLLSNAEGGFSLQVTDVSTATTVTIADNGAGDLTADVNKILISQNVGSFEVFATSGITNTPGTTFAELINGVGSITNLTAQTRTLTLILSASDFTSPIGDVLQGIIASTGQFQNVAGTANIMVSFFYDAGNALFAETSLITSAGYSIAGPQGNQTVDAAGILLGATAPYALTLKINIELSRNAKIDVDSTALLTAAVPEPTSLAILGLGGLLAGFGVARRKRQQAAELTV